MYNLKINHQSLIELEPIVTNNEVITLYDKDLHIKTKSKILHLKNWIYPIYSRSKFLITQLKKLNSTESLLLFKDDIFDINWFNKEAILLWLSIYQELDENNINVLHYIRKFPHKNIENLQLVLNNIDNKLKVKITEKRKFVYIDWLTYTYDDIRNNIKQWIINDDLVSIISFISGLIISNYARVQIDNFRWDSWKKICKGIVLQIPIDWTLLFNKDIIDDIISYLDNKFLISIDKDFIYQIWSHDYELENLIIKTLQYIWFLNKNDDIVIWKYINQNIIKENFLNYLIEIKGLQNYDDYLKKIKNWYIKVITK